MHYNGYPGGEKGGSQSRHNDALSPEDDALSMARAVAAASVDERAQEHGIAQDVHSSADPSLPPMYQESETSTERYSQRPSRSVSYSYVKPHGVIFDSREILTAVARTQPDQYRLNGHFAFTQSVHTESMAEETEVEESPPYSQHASVPIRAGTEKTEAFVVGKS